MIVICTEYEYELRGSAVLQDTSILLIIQPDGNYRVVKDNGPKFFDVVFSPDQQKYIRVPKNVIEKADLERVLVQYHAKAVMEE